MKKNFFRGITLSLVGLIFSSLGVPCIVNANELDVTNNLNGETYISDTELIINGETYTEEKLEKLLETAQEIGDFSESNPQARFVAAAGIYVIPGVGQVALAATGAIVLGGVTIGAGHWAYKTITNWLNSPQISASKAYGIPKGLLDSNGNVKLGSFNQKVKGQNAWKDSKTGYTKEKDTAGHGGRKWKIKDKQGKRKASTDGNGKILSK